jgi:hypothetical protein
MRHVLRSILQNCILRNLFKQVPAKQQQIYSSFYG